MGLIVNTAVMCVLLLPVGAFWVANLSSLNVSAQSAIAPWVKARALSLYLLVFFGGMSIGAICWGVVAGGVGIRNSLFIAAGGTLLSILGTLRFRLAKTDKSSLLPSLHWPTPTVATSDVNDDSPVIVTIEYAISDSNEQSFRAKMQQLRRARIRTGAYRWYLSRDAAQPDRWFETFFVASWAEHQRQHGRVSHEDAALQSEIADLHKGADPPKVTHCLVSYA